MIHPVVRPRLAMRRRARLTVEALETRETPDATLLNASYADGAVYQFNASSGAVTGTLAAPNTPTTGVITPAGMTLGPDGNLYLSAQFIDSILRYDPGTQSFTTFISPSVLTPIATGIRLTGLNPA